MRTLVKLPLVLWEETPWSGCIHSYKVTTKKISLASQVSKWQTIQQQKAMPDSIIWKKAYEPPVGLSQDGGSGWGEGRDVQGITFAVNPD